MQASAPSAPAGGQGVNMDLEALLQGGGKGGGSLAVSGLALAWARS